MNAVKGEAGAVKQQEVVLNTINSTDDESITNE